MDDVRIPIGNCEISYNGMKLNRFADSAKFEAIPKYKVTSGGALQGERLYILEEYNVSVIVSLAYESYDTLKMAMPLLKEYHDGLLQSNHSASTMFENGRARKDIPLIIHPIDAGDSKEFDICIFRAIIDPENKYTRTYDIRKQDKIDVKFIGLPARQYKDEINKSYFYIGDWEKAGVLENDRRYW